MDDKTKTETFERLSSAIVNESLTGAELWLAGYKDLQTKDGSEPSTARRLEDLEYAAAIAASHIRGLLHSVAAELERLRAEVKDINNWLKSGGEG